MAKDKEIQVRIDAVVNKAEASKSLGQLKKSLLEIQELQAQIGDSSSAEFAKLQNAAEATSTKMAGTKDAIGDIQDKVRTLEGTPVERLTGSFGLLKESIMNLDFDKAKIAFGGFNDLASGALDNLKGGAQGAFGSLKEGFSMLKDNPLEAVKAGFSGLAGGIKSLGQTFVSVGKAILTNPIFLLAAIIVAVVAAVIGLLDALGLLKPILNAIKAVIGAIVDAFKAFTDMLGLTTHAQEEMAEKTLASGDKIKKDIASRGKAQEDLYGLIQGLTDDEIKLLEKKSGISIANEKNIQDIKIGTLEATQNQLDKEIEALNAIIEAGGELTEDQKKQLDERKASYAENATAIKQLEADKQRTIIELNRKSNETLNDWKLKNIADDTERAKTQLEATKDEEVRKINLQISEAKRYNQDYSKLVEARTEIYKYFSNEEKKIDDAAAKVEADRRKAEYEKYQANIAKQLEDLKIAEEAKIKQTEEGTEARLKAELNAIDKVEKFQKKSASILELNKNELIIIEQDNLDKRTKLNESFYGNITKLANADAIAQKEIALLNSENDIERFNNSIALLEEQRDIEISNTELSESQKKKITADYASQIRDIEKEKTGYLAIEKQKQLDGISLVAETELSKSQFNLDRSEATIKQKIVLVEENLIKELSLLEAQKTAELNNSELTGAEKEAIEERYRQQKVSAEEETANKINELRQQEVDNIKATLSYYSDIIKSIKGVGNSLIADLTTTILDGISTFADLSTQKFDKLEQKINAYAQAIGGVIQGIVSAVADANKAKLDETLTSIEETNNAEKNALTKRYNSGLLSKADYDKQISDLDKAAKIKEQDAKKKAFEQDKKTKIASATIAGITGAVAAFTGAMTLGPIAGPIVGGLLAGAVGVMTGLNISKISKTKFDSGPDTPTGPPSIGGGGVGEGGAATPTFQPTQFFGLGQTAQTFGGAGGGMTKVYVTETDISSTQNKVRVVEDRATIR